MVAQGDNRLAVLAGEITAAVAEIKASAEVIAERAIQIGHNLIEAKAALPHGRWEEWLTQNVSMSARTARRYMQLAASGLETATVADLGIRAAAEQIATPRSRSTTALSNQEVVELAALLKLWGEMREPEQGRFLAWIDMKEAA